MLTGLSAFEIAAKVRAKEVSCVEVAQAFIDRVGELDGQYGAFLRLAPEVTLEQAAAVQERVDRGEAGLLAGVPIALKDNISTLGIETTCASKILEGYVPPFNATVVEQILAADGVVLGKTNLDEFAMGASTETSAYQLTKNPWDTTRSPGGSSGGSAAAVAAELAPVALGSDTGGSIRQPASLCGIVGFKPTYGRTSRYGLIAFGSSLDQIGPLARNVEDAALLASVTSGKDLRDGTSLPNPPIDISSLKSRSLKGMKVAVPDEMFGDATSPEVQAVIEEAMKTLEGEGVVFTRVSIPSIKLGVTTYYIIAPAEASSNLGRFDGIRYGLRAEGKGHIDLVEKTRSAGFGKEVKTRIMIGTYALSAGYYDAYYVRAQQVRAIMQQEFAQVYQDYDFVLSPTSPITAFKVGELNQDPLAMKLLDYCTIPANMGGMPGISINAGFAGGLPVGLQLLAAPLEDESVLQAAYAIEKALPGASGRPPMP